MAAFFRFFSSSLRSLPCLTCSSRAFRRASEASRSLARSSSCSFASSLETGLANDYADLQIRHLLHLLRLALLLLVLTGKSCFFGPLSGSILLDLLCSLLIRLWLTTVSRWGRWRPLGLRLGLLRCRRWN